jgi:transcriptional regulator with XRE-family HTH domain
MDLTTIGQRIRYLREHQGDNRNAFSRMLGIHYSTLQNIEEDRVDGPSYKTLMALRKQVPYFSWDWLLEGKEPDGGEDTGHDVFNIPQPGWVSTQAEDMQTSYGKSKEIDLYERLLASCREEVQTLNHQIYRLETAMEEIQGHAEYYKNRLLQLEKSN